MSTRDEYVEMTKSAFQTLGKKAAMNFLITKLPFFANPILNPIAGYFIGVVVEGLVTQAETAAFFLYIDMRTGLQAKGFLEAARANQIAQKTGTKKEKEIAAEKLKKEFLAFAVVPN